MPATPLTWLDEFNVNTNTTGLQYDPRITQLANGNILVSWTSDDDTGAGSPAGSDVIGRIYDPMGTALTDEFLLNSTSSGNEFSSDVAGLPGGGMLVVYTRQISGFSDILLTELDSNGGGIPAQVSPFFDGNASADPSGFDPAVSVFSDTSALVVWRETEVGGDSRIVGRTYDSTTNTMGSAVSLINFAGTQNDPDVAALTNGDFVIAASHNTGTDTEIVLRIIHGDGSNVLSATAIASTQDSDTDVDPSVTALAGGGFVVSWTNTDTDTDIQAQLFSASGSLVGSIINVETGGGSDNDNESVVVPLKDGGFLVVYDDDAEGILKVQRFSSSGAEVGDIFNVATGSSITEIDAVSLADGRIALTFVREFGEIGMEILDIRDTVNTPVYGPDSWQVGTVGNDTFIASGAIVHGYKGSDQITDGGGPNAIFGDTGNDTITIKGVSSAESANGGLGTDTLRGASMAAGTVYDLAAGTVTSGAEVQVAAKFENAIGSTAAETILGTSGANRLEGGGGADTLNGRAGADTLVGGAGHDKLIGGAGADKFVFNAPVIAANSDTITGFTHGSDKIQLENTGVFAGIGNVGTLAAAKFWSNTTGNAHDASDRIIYNSTNGNLYYDDDGTGAHAKILIATLTGHPTLTNADIQVI